MSKAARKYGSLEVLLVLQLPASMLTHVQLFETPWTVAYQARCPWDSPGKNTGVVAISFFTGSSRPRN